MDLRAIDVLWRALARSPLAELAGARGCAGSADLIAHLAAGQQLELEPNQSGQLADVLLTALQIFGASPNSGTSSGSDVVRSALACMQELQQSLSHELSEHQCYLAKLAPVLSSLAGDQELHQSPVHNTDEDSGNAAAHGPVLPSLVLDGQQDARQLTARRRAYDCAAPVPLSQAGVAAPKPASLAEIADALSDAIVNLQEALTALPPRPAPDGEPASDTASLEDPRALAPAPRPAEISELDGELAVDGEHQHPDQAAPGTGVDALRWLLDAARL